MVGTFICVMSTVRSVLGVGSCIVPKSFLAVNEGGFMGVSTRGRTVESRGISRSVPLDRVRFSLAEVGLRGCDIERQPGWGGFSDFVEKWLAPFPGTIAAIGTNFPRK